jgi:hypothetical protein
MVEISNMSFNSFAITGEVTMKDNTRWWLTTVDEPQSTTDKITFLAELTERRSLCPGPWMVVGDFNMIMYAPEKNNDLLDMNMMARFMGFAQELQLKDLYMHGRTYTWSNKSEIPTPHAD